MTTIVIAEDHQLVREGLRAMLDAQPDFEVVGEAADGRAALEVVARLRPDVLLVDLTMPGMGGRELAGRVRAVRPEVGVVFISGYAPDASWLNDVPGAVFLAKPFTPTDLLRSTGKAIARAANVLAAPVA